jgi:hypothetical protein
MKYSKGDSQPVYAAIFTRYKYEDPWFVFAFITNKRVKSRMKQQAMEDFLWSSGFRDGLCLKV